MRAVAVAIVSALCLVSIGCSSVGDFCHSDDDCGRGMRCSGSGGDRGVCTYAEGVQDQAIKVDQRLPDSGDDLPGPDLAAPDVAAPDLGKPDLAAPDLAEPDATAPDAATPDADAPDAAKADA